MLSILIHLHDVLYELTFTLAIDGAAEHQLQEVAKFHFDLRRVTALEDQIEVGHCEPAQRMIQHISVIVG